MTASDFHFMGMQVLESEDMVNWRIISQVYRRLDYKGWDENERYAGGSWAPAIRFHDGRFWIFFCTPDEGLFMSNAENPSGPWSPLHLVAAVPKWEDPCPFWDEDGKAYLGRSIHGAGPIIIHRMSADGKQLLDSGFTVYTGPVAEGTKIFKKDSYYYLSIPEGGVSGGWQTVLRSKNIYGPYEKKVVLEQGSTDINGPHQGAIVDTPEGEWWFYHFQHAGTIGRVVHLQPMYWHDGWPVIGVDMDRNGTGEPVYVWKKPKAGAEVFFPQTDDTFDASELGLQWQWNHNPVNEAWSLSRKKGSLTLEALPSKTFRSARNTLTQKIMGYESEATVELDMSEMADGQWCGLVCMGRENKMLGIMKKEGRLTLYLSDETAEIAVTTLTGKKIYLQVSIDIPAHKFVYSYSLDNKKYIRCGEAFDMAFGFWKGARIGLYCYNTERESGMAIFNSFVYKHDGGKN
jgi:beta-xylosidase